jgi:hypothetical protein
VLLLQTQTGEMLTLFLRLPPAQFGKVLIQRQVTKLHFTVAQPYKLLRNSRFAFLLQA